MGNRLPDAGYVAAEVDSDIATDSGADILMQPLISEKIVRRRPNRFERRSSMETIEMQYDMRRAELRRSKSLGARKKPSEIN